MVKDKKSKSFKILAAADIHGNSAVSESLARKAEKEKVDLVILAGDIHGFDENRGIIAPFKKRNQKVIFVPGNWDTSFQTKATKDFYKIKDIDGYYVHYDGVDIIGVGTKDFKMNLDEKKTLDRLIKNFEKVQNRPSRKVLVSHLHASGTLAEFSGIPGEEVLAKAIKYFQPDVFIAGHIHEAEGLEHKVGKTKVIQVGKHGKIIEIKKKDD
ncbi:Calcineurin-like phosphoesterase superfamily domain protein [uncultured archaeon]|nr:Calcineurin-like phosphoesterase superfamily domain protein [uncultured archaeon]